MLRPNTAIIYCFVCGVFLVYLFIYFERERETEKETVSRGGAGMWVGEERIPSRPCAVSAEPKTGLELENCEIMTRTQIKSETLNRVSHPGAPLMLFLKRSLCCHEENELRGLRVEGPSFGRPLQWSKHLAVVTLR